MSLTRCYGPGLTVQRRTYTRTCGHTYPCMGMYPAVFVYAASWGSGRVSVPTILRSPGARKDRSL